MGIFKKGDPKGTAPQLPELPKLPNYSNLENDGYEKSIHQLPSYPNNPVGEKFSQNSIKEAVTGKRESDRGGPNANEFETFTTQRMPEPPKQKAEINNYDFSEEEIESPKMFQESFEPISSKNIYRGEPEIIKEKGKKQTKIEPVFIRIDKFEEALNVFEDSKEKLREVDEMLKEIKRIRIEEKKELEEWEHNLQSIKSQIERVDKELFSKLE